MRQTNIYRKVCQVPERGYKASVHEMKDLCTDGARNMEFTVKYRAWVHRTLNPCTHA